MKNLMHDTKIDIFKITDFKRKYFKQIYLPFPLENINMHL